MSQRVNHIIEQHTGDTGFSPSHISISHIPSLSPLSFWSDPPPLGCVARVASAGIEVSVIPLGAHLFGGTRNPHFFFPRRLRLIPELLGSCFGYDDKTS